MSAPPQTDAEAGSLDIDVDALEDYEEFWRDHYDWLKQKGYQLRPRYRPGWVPSWKGTKKRAMRQEDYLVPLHPFLLDAIRIEDGKPVMLRRPDPESMSGELKITRLLSSEAISSEPGNHCVPIYETLQLAHASTDSNGRDLIAVMPCLARWDVFVPFESVGEVVDFCSQLFEGLQFLHNINIAHKDVKALNIMMDWFPFYASPPHPLDPKMKYDWSGSAKPRSRTRHPVKYYYIDFNLSQQFEPNDRPLQPPGYGGDQSVPEFRRNEMCDPFAVDVYCLGNVIRAKLLAGDYLVPPKRNLEFLQGLISDMTHDDPRKRPSMNDVVSRFEEIRKGLSWWKLRSRVSNKNEHPLFRFLLTPIHWLKQTSYILRGIPAVPDYIMRE